MIGVYEHHYWTRDNSQKENQIHRVCYKRSCDFFVNLYRIIISIHDIASSNTEFCEE